MYANLDFETNIVQICCKLSEIYNFKIDNHSQFYEANFGNFWEVIFFSITVVASFQLIIILVASVQTG